MEIFFFYWKSKYSIFWRLLKMSCWLNNSFSQIWCYVDFAIKSTYRSNILVKISLLAAYLASFSWLAIRHFLLTLAQFFKCDCSNSSLLGALSGSYAIKISIKNSILNYCLRRTDWKRSLRYWYQNLPI